MMRVPGDDEMVEDLHVYQGKADLNERVRISSAWLGSGTPEGWLCAKMTAAAFVRSVAFTTSRG